MVVGGWLEGWFRVICFGLLGRCVSLCLLFGLSGWQFVADCCS